MPTWGARVGEGRCERGRLTRFGCLRRVRGLETVLQALSKDLQNDPGMPDPCGALGTLTRESKKVPNFTYTFGIVGALSVVLERPTPHPVPTVPICLLPPHTCIHAVECQQLCVGALLDKTPFVEYYDAVGQTG